MSIDLLIDNEVMRNEVVLFMKGTPQFPMCGFSGQVVQILDNLGVAYKGLNSRTTTCVRASRPIPTGRPSRSFTSRANSVGGCDIVREIFHSGELQSLLKDKGVATKASATA